MRVRQLQSVGFTSPCSTFVAIVQEDQIQTLTIAHKVIPAMSLLACVPSVLVMTRTSKLGDG